MVEAEQFTCYVASSVEVDGVVRSLTAEEYVRVLVEKYELSTQHVRSSSTLRDMFNQIAITIAERGYIRSWGLYCMKARLDALQKLAVEQLCIPSYMTALGVGADSISSIPLLSWSSSSRRTTDALVERVRALLTDIFLLFVCSENQLLRDGSDRELDRMRAEVFLGLIRLKCSPLYPQSIVLKEYGPSALEALTCHILGVSAVNAVIRAELRHVTVHLINVLEDAALQVQGIEIDHTVLLETLDIYFQWLRDMSEGLIKDCRREEIIAAVNPSVRAALKAETYSSSAHLVRVYHSKYQSLLHNLPVPLQPYSLEDMKQAQKDILRENIKVNQILYIGGRTPSSSLSSGQDISLDAEYVDKYAPTASAVTVDATEAIGEEIKKVVVFLCGLPDPELLQTSPIASKKTIQPITVTAACALFNAPTAASRALDVDEPIAAPSLTLYRDLHRILLAYTLLAASRTYALGDAFMILNDLYGGEGLMFCPYVPNNASAPSTPSRRKGDTPPPSTSTTCDCQVAITTSGVKVKLREHYRLYATADMNKCSNHNRLPPPLASFECTTTTIIILSVAEDASFGKLFEVLVSNPQKIVHRAVTIEPYV